MNVPPESVVERLVCRAGDLYSLPAVALKVLELTDSPRVDVRALKECLENDPALTSKILRVVNSSLFGLPREVSDLHQALALLGIKPLKMLVLGFSLPKNLFTALEADVLSRYWRQALTKAIVARELAQRYWSAEADEAFIAGLLQEIGQLVLIQQLGEPYVRFLHRAQSGPIDLLQLELETLGFDHAVLSARLLDRWGLPETIVEAIGAPHDAGAITLLRAPARSLAEVLHVAEMIARMLTADRPPAIETLGEVCREYGQLSLDDLPALLGDLDEKVQQLADVLNLQLGEAHDYRQVLADAQHQLSGVAEDAAIELLEASRWRESGALTEAVTRWTRQDAPVPSTPTAAGVMHQATAAPTTRRQEPAISAARFAPEPWSDPGLVGRLGLAIGGCRQQRRPLSLILVSVDHFDDWVMMRGVEATRVLVERLHQALVQPLDDAIDCVPLGDGCFALLLADHDRGASVGVARELQGDVRKLAERLLESTGETLTISQGLASLGIPPKNFPPAELIAAARRCLDAARLSGGDTVKSIEIV